MAISPLNYLNAGAHHGSFLTDTKYPSTPADVDALFQFIQEQKIPKLTIHFHGGLVPEKEGMEIAEFMASHYTGVSHPLTVVWETGILKTLTDQYSEVEKTELFQKLREIVLKKVCSKLGISDGARGDVEVDKTTIQTELQKDQPFDHYDDPARQKAENWDELTLEGMHGDIETELETDLMLQEDELITTVKADGPEDTYYKKEYVIPETATPDGSRGIISLAVIKPLASVAIRVIKRFWNKTDHGLYPTVMEEIFREFYIAELGVKVWDGIKEKAEKMWADNRELAGNAQHAGRYLLDALAKHAAANPGFIVDLVGHSAGSIAICHMLKCMNDYYPSLLPVRNILFLAPACRTDLFQQEIMKHPDRYQSLRIFTMTDQTEREDHCVPVVYTHSLLYLVSGILEGMPDAYVLGLARQLADEKPYQDVALLKEVREFLHSGDRLVFSPSPADAPPGFTTTSKKHGDFDNNDDPTITSLVHIIKQ